MRRRRHGDQLRSDIDTDGLAFLVDIRKMLQEFLQRDMTHVEVHMFRTRDLHFIVDSARHDIAGSQVFPRIVPLHESFASCVSQDAAVAAHGFSDEEGLAFYIGFIQGGGMELDKLHVFYPAFGAV